MAKSEPKLSYKARRRLSLLWLVVGLPLYVIVCVNVVDLFERPPILMELLVYIVLGVAWAFPMRQVFLGVGREDPDAEPKE